MTRLQRIILALPIAAGLVLAGAGPAAAAPEVSKRSCEQQGGTFTTKGGTKSCTTTVTGTSEECSRDQVYDPDMDGTGYKRRTYGTCTTTYTTTTTQRGNAAPTTTSSSQTTFVPNGESDCIHFGPPGQFIVDDELCDRYPI